MGYAPGMKTAISIPDEVFAEAERLTLRIVQGDAFNRSRIATVVCVPLTSNLRWADAPGNVLLAPDPLACRGTPSQTCRRS
jgi:hypothetical protein